MKLTDTWFKAHFYGDIGEDESFRTLTPSGDPWPFSTSQGLWLWCPCGYGKPEFPLDGPRPHAILVPFSNPPSGVPVPDNHGCFGRDGKTRPRWTVSGTGLNNLTIKPSIAVGKDPECWHGFITNGEIC